MEPISATGILVMSNATLQERGQQRDVGEERSMARIVAVFNTLTGQTLTELDGWTFMLCLKLVRSQRGAFHLDDWIDLASYAALAGECGSHA